MLRERRSAENGFLGLLAVSSDRRCSYLTSMEI